MTFFSRRDALGMGAASAAGLLSAGNVMAGVRQGFKVPAEEDAHEATFTQWPVNRQVHPDRVFLGMLQQTIADIANTFVDFEPVIMLAAKVSHAKARRFLSNKVELWDIPTEDLWARDSGPLFAINPEGQRAITQLNFNGWGGKQIHKRDGNIAAEVAQVLDLPIRDSGLVGEAGGLDQDGRGTLIAHESSWVNKNRNNLTRPQIERRLLTAFGADRVIWAPGLWGEDITDFHIDSLARFISRDRVLIQLPDNPDETDPFHMAALETHDILLDAGLTLDVIPEPTRPRVKSLDFVASYANYYVCNGGLIAAQFGDPVTDAIALAALKQHYPNREIVTLNVDPLGEVGGGIHCATQQMPAT